jgi:group I intron endonuclease
VPIQKCSKLNNNLFKNGMYISKHTYTTLSNNILNFDNLNYVKFYENIFDMKKDILNENKGKSGIYMLTNKVTKKIYIGLSTDLSKRFKNYFSLSYLKSKTNLIINRALIKYKYSNFSLTILEYCDKSNLKIREQFYIYKFNPQYNILKGAGNSLNSKHLKKIKIKNNKSLNRVSVQEKSTLIESLQTEANIKLMNLTKLKESKPLIVKPSNTKSKELLKQKASNSKQSENIKLKLNVISGNHINIYEKFSSKGFKLIGSFVSARRASKFLGISGSTVIKYKNSCEIFKDRYKFSSK